MDVLQPVRLFRLAVAGMLGHEHVEALGELFHEGLDHRRAARAVQVQERLALAAAPQVSAAAFDGDELVAELQVPVFRCFFSTPDCSIATGIAEKFIGAITCAPPMPGISASCCSSSTQIFRPSAFGSCAFSRRCTIESGMRVPNSFSFIHIAERTDGIGAMPIRTGRVTPLSRNLFEYLFITSISMLNCVWTKSAPAAVFACRPAGFQSGAGSVGISATPSTRSSLPWISVPGGSLCVERIAFASARRPLLSR